MPVEPSFTYVDLFAGIGGFAAALEGMGGRCVYSVEIDADAAAVYERNWGHSPLGDITQDANDFHVNVPEHDVLAAGFPCQPFSKSGAQRGMDEARGTLFWNIARIVERRRPRVVILENVRNIAGPRHRHEWEVIIATLRELGYRVSDDPAVFSPHLLPLEMGGRPHNRERVFITATYDPHALGEEDGPARPAVSNVSLREKGEDWDIADDLPLDVALVDDQLALTSDERAWIGAWDDFVQIMREAMRQREGVTARLPGFPIWVDNWVREELLDDPTSSAFVGPGTPRWKENFLRKNAALYTRYQDVLDAWIERSGVRDFPPSRRKFEWQAQETATLWQCVMQMRPSGIRAKRPTHLPALVAITQTSVIGSLERRLSPREAARLQGFPDSFRFDTARAGEQHHREQRRSLTYKQLGNGVNVGVVWHVLKAHVARDASVMLKKDKDGAFVDPRAAAVYAAVENAPKTPDDVLDRVVAEGQKRYEVYRERGQRLDRWLRPTDI